MAVETAYLNTPGVTGRAEIVKIAGTIDPTTGTSSSSISTRAASYSPQGTFQQIVEPASSTALPSIPASATVAFIQNNGSQPARWRDDGQAPTATAGQRIAAGQTLTYDGSLSAFRVIREAAGVTLDILYYG